MLGATAMRHNFSRRLIVATAAVWILAVIGCARSRVTVVDDAALRAADADPANWITYGHTYSEQRFSPLRQIDEQSVTRLGLAWSFDLGTLRGLEATPLVQDGVLYTSSAWSLVYAVDARTGRLLWQYDPHVPRRTLCHHGRASNRQGARIHWKRWGRVRRAWLRFGI